MAEYKSEVKSIYFPIRSVYEKISDLTNVEKIKTTLENPALRDALLQQAGGKVSPEQMSTFIERLQTLECTPDTLSGDAAPLGRITLRIVEREPEKTVKFALEGAPMPANLWIQLLPAGDAQCAMRVTVKAELNFFIKKMIGSKLQQGVDGLAQMLAAIPYGY